MNILCYSSYAYPYISGLTLYVKRLLDHLSLMHRCTWISFFPQTISNTTAYRQKKIPYHFRIGKGHVSLHSLSLFQQEISRTDVVLIFFPNLEAIFLVVLAVLYRKPLITVFVCFIHLENILMRFFLYPLFISSLLIHGLLSKRIIVSPGYIQSIPFHFLWKSKIRYAFPPVSQNTKASHSIVQKYRKRHKYMIGYAGRLSSEKGIEYLIDALSTFDIKPLLLIATPSFTSGETSYRKSILTRLEKTGVQYQLFEDLSDSEFARFLSEIDVLVLPSVSSTEAFGMVQIEAMMQGTPVVATNLPGVRVPIEKTQMGILVPPRNAGEIKKALLQIFKNKKKYAKNIKTISPFLPQHTFLLFDSLLFSY